MLRILNAEPEGYSAEARAILSELGEVVEERIHQDDLSQQVQKCDVLIVRLRLRVKRNIIESAPRLKGIVSATTGLDHIDVEAAREHGVAVLSLKGETDFLKGTPATAEHTWGLLLSLMRKIPQSIQHVREGLWDRDQFRGNELLGKRLGVIGLGRIGEKIARYGLAFEMQVGGYDPYRENWIDNVQRFTSLEDLLRWSQIVSIHIPLNDETTGMLSKHECSLMRQGAYLINTSRGAVIDEAAICNSLESEKLAGVAVDVLEIEQPIESRQKSPLLQYASNCNNIIITPHIGGATLESMTRTEVFMAEKLQQFVLKVLR